MRPAPHEPIIVTPERIRNCAWVLEFDDRRGPHVTGYRCREFPRATMLHTRSGRLSTLIHYVDGVRCAGGFQGIASALNRPHDRDGVPARLAALLLRIASATAEVTTNTNELLVARGLSVDACRTLRETMPQFEGLIIDWIAVPAMEKVT